MENITTLKDMVKFLIKYDLSFDGEVFYYENSSYTIKETEIKFKVKILYK